jgi:hypothetical protein
VGGTGPRARCSPSPASSSVFIASNTEAVGRAHGLFQLQSAPRPTDRGVRAALFAARANLTSSARRSMAVPWRERPRDLAALAITPAATEVVAHATLSLPQPERWSSEAFVRARLEDLQIRVVNSGRRPRIVRLATRALKALRAPIISLRPRCARLAALTTRAVSHSLATIDGRSGSA